MRRLTGQEKLAEERERINDLDFMEEVAQATLADPDAPRPKLRRAAMAANRGAARHRQEAAV